MRKTKASFLKCTLKIVFFIQLNDTLLLNDTALLLLVFAVRIYTLVQLLC